MGKISRLGLSVTPDMYKQLQSEAEKRGATVANLVREYILRGLADDGHTISHHKVTWGGDRRSKKHNEESENS